MTRGAAVVPVHLWCRDSFVVAERTDVVPESGLPVGLDRAVQFRHRGVVQIANDGGGIGNSKELDKFLEDVRAPVRRPQVDQHPRIDVRTLDLDDRLSAVVQNARVYLRYRCGRERDVVEFREQVVHGVTEVLLHDASGLLGRERRNIVEAA